MPLPEDPGIAGSVDYYGPLPVTQRGNTYILVFTDRFSRQTDMHPVTAAEFTMEGTINILVNQYIRLWGCPRTILSDHELQFFCKLSQLNTSCWVWLLSPQLERMRRAGKPHYGPISGYDRQRATRRLGLASAPRRIRLQQFRQRGDGSGAQQGPHGHTPTAPLDGFRPH